MELLYKVYKILHNITKKVVYSLPISEAIKALLIRKLSKIIPLKILLIKVRLPNPISFNKMTLIFREDDNGDLGIINCLSRNEYYEPEVVRVIKRYLKKGAVFIDGGAHIGYFSITAANIVGKEGKVFSFEPFIESYLILKKMQN